MATLNQCEFIGRLGKNPEMSYTPSGKAITKFSLAVDQGKGQKTLWLNIVCWSELAERMNTYLYKGAQVFVQGRLQIGTYEDKTTKAERQAVEIVATIIQLLDKKPEKADEQEEPV